ncbi:ribosome maturation factor RimM [Vandammella animalimorsus]|uniref:Ribosome maturation factor RimM n=1 Tax=Vandammella animalimorsus TaxID=2029117 RepID=A0A2A2ASI6_9BURK|nr:ribosome maturation factor RimM [Vandammella animalimorsus]PAT40717.1 ribosome maturation factor RimM [Vandammella animalimorsus]
MPHRKPPHPRARAAAGPAPSPEAAAPVGPQLRQALAQLVAEAPPEPLIDLARITGAWGVRGWIKLAPFSADADALHEARDWFIAPPDAQRRQGPRHFDAPLQVHVLQLKPQGDALVAQLQGVDDRDVAQALRGATIALPRSAFPALPEGEFYWVDLLGLQVRNRQAVVLGTVAQMLSNGPQSVLVVREQPLADAPTPRLRERLIPFVDAYVDSVSLADGQIVVDWQPDY